MILPRREFSKDVQRRAYLRSGGICECHRIPHVFIVFCGLQLGQGNTFFEHIDPDGNGGEPTFENCAVLTRACWRYKTDRYDAPIVAKTKRLFDRAHGVRDPWRRRLPGGKDSAFKIKMDGTVVSRRRPMEQP